MQLAFEWQCPPPCDGWHPTGVHALHLPLLASHDAEILVVLTRRRCPWRSHPASLRLGPRILSFGTVVLRALDENRGDATPDLPARRHIALEVDPRPEP